jgi:hypothetical protein
MVTTGKEYPLAFLIIIVGAALYYMNAARKGKLPKVRSIAALDAIPEVVGRATEMKKAVHFSTGEVSALTGAHSLMTLAGIAILGHVTRLCAKYDTELLVTAGGRRTGQLVPLLRETVRTSYEAEGKGKKYHDDMVTYLSPQQGTYSIAVEAIFATKKPAANFMIGAWANSNINVLERAAREKSITVAGSPRGSQMPIMACLADYALIFGEIFAAEAAIRKDPDLLGALQGQDIGNWLWLAVMLIAGLGMFFGVQIW